MRAAISGQKSQKVWYLLREINETHFDPSFENKGWMPWKKVDNITRIAKNKNLSDRFLQKKHQKLFTRPSK